MESLSESERPRYVVTSDFARIRVLDLGAQLGEEQVVSFALEELPANVETLGFLAGHRPRTFGSTEQEQASIAAAQLMADLYEELEKTGYPDHHASVFLVRVLFALYADDAGLWSRDTFTRYIEERTSPDGHDLGAALVTLFQVLNHPLDKRYTRGDELLAEFPYVNGSLFGETVHIPFFDRTMREKLLRACDFNWASISPAIFGSLFQAVKSKEARRELGEHYTTETNILKVIHPLFLDELEERFERDQDSKTRLLALQAHLGQLRFLDPACGCGNFLIVAYRELRALELRILNRLQELDPARSQMVLDATELVHVKMTNFYGIELEEWPATIARTAMLLVDHQANQDMATTLGMAPPSLPLEDSSAIRVGNALRIDWHDLLPASDQVYVFGNPPFLGDHTRGADQLADLKGVWGTATLSRLDYVTGWYKKAIDYFGLLDGRWAFVSTNSITQGDQPARLFGPIFSAGWRIRFAHRTFAWTSEAPGAAAVHCVVIGFDRKTRPAARLFDYPTLKGAPVEEEARTINAYLVVGPNILVSKRMEPIALGLPTVDYGSKPTDGGYLVLDQDEAEQLLNDPRSARFVRPYVGSRELINGSHRWCLWLVDATGSEIARHPELRRRVEAVRDFRAASKAASTRNYPHHHLFRQFGITSEEDFVGIPEVSSENRRYLPVGHLAGGTIISNKVYGALDPDGFVFAIAASSMLITWMKTIGGRLKSDLSFSSTITWNNLPLPVVDAVTRERVIGASRGVLAAREQHPERSLAEHYNPLVMDSALLKAHDKLDAAVDRAFGAKRTCTSEKERQEVLFARYAEMSTENELPTPRPARTSRRRNG
jgi:hypothetical protein